MRFLEILPPALKALSKPPERLYFKGDERLLDLRRVAIVGSRRPSAYTRSSVLRLSQALSARNVAIVSGGAMGVDAIAHEGAFPTTIAVMATGLDVCYPKVNESLLKAIYEKALAISEYAPGTNIMRHFFVERNRIIIALSEAVVIAQADLKSGSMQSAKIAIKLGKPLYVLPQRLGESDGTNELLKNKEAELINNIDEFAKNFGEVLNYEDPILNFCKNNPSLEAALARHGTQIYTYELEGKLKIIGTQIVVQGA